MYFGGNMQNKRLIIIIGVIVLLLLIPLFAMQFTDEVMWDRTDFAVMGALLLGTGLLGSFIVKKVQKTKHRILLCILLAVVFMLVWGELAVGIFGTPLAGN